MGAENVNQMLLPFPNDSEQFLHRLVRPFRGLSRRLPFWWPLPLANKHEAISARPAACRFAPTCCVSCLAEGTDLTTSGPLLGWAAIVTDVCGTFRVVARGVTPTGPAAPGVWYTGPVKLDPWSSR